MEQQKILALIGLGNPGPKFRFHRHNIGFLILNALAEQYNVQWSAKDNLEHAMVRINEQPIILVKPQTFMNTSGAVIPFLQKKGIKPENILVVHDELEKKFGNISHKFGGSARGHNGLRSIIAACGKDFGRIRFGIGRPENKEDVGNYVLQNFTESDDELNQLIVQATELIESLITTN